MTLKLLLLGIHYTLCGLGSIVVYIAIAILVHARAKDEWDIEPEALCGLAAIWPPIVLAVGFYYFFYYIYIIIRHPCARIYSLCCNIHDNLNEKTLMETRILKSALAEKDKPEPVTCDVCRKKMRQGVYR